jgi:hypothetical protein
MEAASCRFSIVYHILDNTKENNRGESHGKDHCYS